MVFLCKVQLMLNTLPYIRMPISISSPIRVRMRHLISHLDHNLLPIASYQRTHTYIDRYRHWLTYIFLDYLVNGVLQHGHNKTASYQTFVILKCRSSSALLLFVVVVVNFVFVSLFPTPHCSRLLVQYWFWKPKRGCCWQSKSLMKTRNYFDLTTNKLLHNSQKIKTKTK